MFSLLISSAATPRYAQLPTNKEKLRAFGSCGSCESSSSVAINASACGVDASCAYTIPPAMAATETNREIIKASFLRDISNPPERFCCFHARELSGFQIVWVRSERRHLIGAQASLPA